MGFLSRFTDMPSLDVLRGMTSGVVVIDRTVAGVPRGAASGVAAIVGEFADMTYAVAISALGAITTSPRPVEIDGDFEAKLGGFDETIGEFGGDCGNGFTECRGLKFSRLVAVPVNLASSQGVRLYRELPTNKSATDPSPVVEITGVTVPAGTEFRSGGNRVRSAAAVSFTGNAEYTRGVDGAVTLVGAAAAFQDFVAAGGNFQSIVRDDGKVGVKVGDILVLGVVGGAGAFGANAYTLRVKAVTNGTTLSVEKLDGSTFDWTTGTLLPWRLYRGTAADSGLEFAQASQGGYKIPARPLDATIAINITLTPTVLADPAAPTATTWAPLSGLKMRSAPVTGIVYTAAIQAANAVNHASIDTLYGTAITAVLEDVDPTSDVSIIWAARKSTGIRTALKTFTATRKAQGRGCVFNWSPALDATSKDTALSDAGTGVGTTRAREGHYAWPGVVNSVPEAVGFSIARADGTTSTDGMMDQTSDAYLSSVMSCLQPERNPGEATGQVQELLAGWISIQSGVTGLDRGFYTRAKNKGIMAPRISRGAQGQSKREFQDGVTTSLLDGETESNVRRFSFYAEDTCAAIVEPYSKQLLTTPLKGDIVTALTAFCQQLKDDGRITDYRIDAVSGNTAALSGSGIYVVKVLIEMVPDARIIVVDAQVGLGVFRTSSSLLPIAA